MIKFIKRYWLELLVFGAIIAVLFIDQAPNMTWINTNSDGVHYTYAAKHLYSAHKGGAPLYLLLGHLFLYIPFGSEYWRMGLISVLSTGVATIFVYMIIKQLLPIKNWRIYALLGSLIYGGSVLVISQSTIVETYALTTMLSLMAYYFVIVKRYLWSSLVMGLGMAVHPLLIFVIAPLFLANKPLRHWKYVGIILACGLFYSYNFIVARFNPPPVDMWSNLTLKSAFVDFSSTATMLTGGLAIYDMPKRILDTIGVMAVSLGLGLAIIIVYLIKIKQWWKTELFWLFALPLGYFVTDLAPQTYVYLMPTIGFGAIIVALQLSKMKIAWVWATGLVAVSLFAFNANYMDIGRTLDPELSAYKFYTEDMPKIPENNIFMPQYGWEWAMAEVYIVDENRNLRVVAMDTIISEAYRKSLDLMNINYDYEGSRKLTDRLDKQNLLASSVVRMNDDVWTTTTTSPDTYGATVINANGNDSLVMKIPTELPGRWHWKPSNPYGFITGGIEIEEWAYITLSNYNALFFMVFGSLGLVVNKLLSMALPYLNRKRLNAKG